MVSRDNFYKLYMNIFNSICVSANVKTRKTTTYESYKKLFNDTRFRNDPKRKLWVDRNTQKSSGTSLHGSGVCDAKSEGESGEAC